MKINGKETEIVVCAKDLENIDIKIDDDALKQAPKIRCLVSLFTEDGKK